MTQDPQHAPDQPTTNIINTALFNKEEDVILSDLERKEKGKAETTNTV